MNETLNTPKQRGRPRIKQILDVDDSEKTITINEDLSIVEEVEEIPSDVVEDEEELVFISTGNIVKDRALKGVIADSFILFKEANKQGKWEEICASANPAGECEKFAIGQYICKDDVISVLKLVKKLIISRNDGLTIIKAYSKYILPELIARVVDIEESDTTETSNVEDTPVIKLAVGTVLTCSTDSSKTYTIGQRGRISNWAMQMIESFQANSTVEDEVETVVDIETETDDKNVIATEMTVGTVLTCPTDSSKTYVVGSRGRKPKWIKDLELQSNTTSEVVEDEVETVVDMQIDSIFTIVTQKTLSIGTVLTCPTDSSKTYTVGSRGRKSFWVIDEINRLTQE